MNQHSDIDHVLSRWLEDGPVTMPDRIVEVVAGRIGHQPQRRRWRLRGRLLMNTYAKLAAAAAAILVVGLVGWQLLLGVGGGPGTPTVAPTASPTAPPISPSTTAKPNTVSLKPIAGNPLDWRVTVPAGWTNSAGWYLYPNGLGTEGPNGVSASFLNVPEVPVDSCNFPGPVSNTNTVADLIAAIHAKSDWVVSTPTDVIISGFSGQRVDVDLPTDLSACGESNYVVFSEPGTENGFYAQGPANKLRLWVLDVNGRIVILQRESFEGTPAQRVAEAQQILETSVITP